MFASFEERSSKTYYNNYNNLQSMSQYVFLSEVPHISSCLTHLHSLMLVLENIY